MSLIFISSPLCCWAARPPSRSAGIKKRCGRSRPANNRPFMMPCNAMMIPLPPHPPACTSLHSCTGMSSNKIPQRSATAAPSPYHTPLPPSLPSPSPPPPPHQRCLPAIATEPPSLPNKRDGEGKKLLGGGAWGVGGSESTKRGFISVSFAPKEKRGAHI